MPQLSLFAEPDLPDAKPDAVAAESHRPPKPRHGPYAECEWVEAVVKPGRDGRPAVVSPARWRVRLNELGQRFVEAYLKQYPKPANLAHRQAPDRADELFASHNDGEEAHQLARLAVVQAALIFDPEFVSPRTGEKIRPKAYLSRFVMGAFWRAYRATFEEVDGMVRPDAGDRGGGGPSDPAVTWATAETAKAAAGDAAAVDARHEVARLLPLLSPQDRRAVQLVYGVGGEQPLGLEATAQRLGMKDPDELKARLAAAFARIRVMTGHSSD